MIFKGYKLLSWKIGSDDFMSWIDSLVLVNNRGHKLFIERTKTSYRAFEYTDSGEEPIEAQESEIKAFVCEVFDYLRTLYVI